jgi:hypothetical protein
MIESGYRGCPQTRAGQSLRTGIPSVVLVGVGVTGKAWIRIDLLPPPVAGRQHAADIFVRGILIGGEDLKRPISWAKNLRHESRYNQFTLRHLHPLMACLDLR